MKLFVQFWQACRRFPLMIASALLAFILIIINQHLPELATYKYLHNKLARITFEAIAGISVFYAFHIYAENKNLDWAKRLGFILLGLCLLALHYYSIPTDVYNFGFEYLFRYIILIFCFHLIISFSIYFHSSEINAFWQYNVFIFTRFITGLGYSLVLFIGTSGLVFAADNLFDLHISSIYYVDIMAFYFIVVTTFYFTANLPLDTHIFEKETEYKNSLRIFIQYVLLFILLGYAIILSTYLGKVIFTNQKPDVYVSIPILIFAAIGLLTFLLAYPIKDGPYYWINSFCKNFFYILLPFLVLNLITISKKISIDGLTEIRYLTLLLGVWLIFISVYLIVNKKDNIILIPISLFACLILVNFGPWSLENLSGYSQYHLAKKILKNNQLINKNKIVNTSDKKIKDSDKKRLYDALQYLYTHGQLDRLHEITDSNQKVVLSRMKEEGFNEQYVGTLIGSSLDLYISPDEVSQNMISFTLIEKNINQEPQATYGFQKIMLINCSDRTILTDGEVPDTNTQVYIPILMKNHIMITNGKDTCLKVDLSGYATHLKQVHRSHVLDQSSLSQALESLPFRNIEANRKELSFHESKYAIIPDFVQCASTGDSLLIKTMSAYVFFN